MGKPKLAKKPSKVVAKSLEQDISGIKIKKQGKLEQIENEVDLLDDDLDDFIKVDPRKLEKLQTNLQKDSSNSKTIKIIKQHTTNMFVVDDNNEEDQLVNLFDDVNVLTNDEETLLQKIKTVDNQVDLLTQLQQVYSQLQPILRQYRSGIMPKLLKWVPTSQLWFQILEFTGFETWSPQAMYGITRLFIASLPEDQAYIFLSQILVPACITDIKKHQKLNIHYFNALIRSKYKCFAFFRALVIFAAEQHINATFTKVVNAVLQKVSLQRNVIVPGLLQLLKIPPNNQLYAIVAVIVSKNYSLPSTLLGDIIQMYETTAGEQQTLVWHEGLLRLARIYGDVLSSEQQIKLYQIVQKNWNAGGISDEIVRVIRQLGKNSGAAQQRVVGANDIVI